VKLSHAIAIFLVAILASGCASKQPISGDGVSVQSSGDYTIGLALRPSPPVQGNTTIVVTVKDASGNAVSGAAVKIATTMPEMSMRGPTLSAQDNADGSYSALTNLNYATKWVFNISVTNDGKRAMGLASVHVK
jgi:YtkA-like